MLCQSDHDVFMREGVQPDDALKATMDVLSNKGVCDVLVVLNIHVIFIGLYVASRPIFVVFEQNMDAFPITLKQISACVSSIEVNETLTLLFCPVE